MDSLATIRDVLSAAKLVMLYRLRNVASKLL
jgi:hypothetical protein